MNEELDGCVVEEEWKIRSPTMLDQESGLGTGTIYKEGLESMIKMLYTDFYLLLFNC